MKSLWIIAPLGLALVTAACGETRTQRATTGAAGGAVAGAAVGGPIGAVAGGAAGAAGGATREKIAPGADDNRVVQRADQAVDNTTDRVRGAVRGSEQGKEGSSSAGAAPDASDAKGRQAAKASGQRAGDRLTNEQVREAQIALRDMGLYKGKIDGIYGKQTASAVDEFQQKHKIPQSRGLDQRTMQALQQQARSSGGAGAAQQGAADRPRASGDPQQGELKAPEETGNRSGEPASEQPAQQPSP